MAGFLNLRELGGFALRLREKNVCEHVKSATAMSGWAAGGGEMVEGMRPLARWCVSFRTTEYAGIGEILIGSTAIRNRCNH
jgi:hypothetical protein